MLRIHSDSMASLMAMLKRASTAPAISAVLREINLEEAEIGGEGLRLTHIPGAVNVWPDALSRLLAPEPKELPAIFQSPAMIRERVPARKAKFWRTTGQDIGKTSERKKKKEKKTEQ